jgi:hypothetical protein
MAFTQIQNELFKLGYEEAVMITVIQSWSKSKKEHFMSQQEYCETYHLSIRTYCRILKKLKDNGIIEVVRRLPNNRQVLKINTTELEFILDKGYLAKVAQSPCQSDSSTLPTGHSDTDNMAVLDCQTGTTHILDKELDKVTIEDTKISTKPEAFSFDIFKEEVTSNNVDPILASLAEDFDNNY